MGQEYPLWAALCGEGRGMGTLLHFCCRSFFVFHATFEDLEIVFDKVVTTRTDGRQTQNKATYLSSKVTPSYLFAPTVFERQILLSTSFEALLWVFKRLFQVDHILLLIEKNRLETIGSKMLGTLALMSNAIDSILPHELESFIENLHRLRTCVHFAKGNPIKNLISGRKFREVPKLHVSKFRLIRNT
eukprot:g80356.t1